MTQTEKALAKAKTTEVRSLRDWIADPVMQAQFKMALPKFFTPERFVRIALTQLTKNPKLASCTQASVMGCLLSCAELGIEPDGRKAHLIPYGDQCTLIIDYKGLVALARRSGEISYIHADVVCWGDKFEYSYGSEAKLTHVPSETERGDFRCAYSFVKLKDGSEDFLVMNKDEIELIRKRSKAKDSGPWLTDYAEMCKKTVFRRHSKWLPVSSEFQEAIEKDYDVPVDITPASPAIAPVKRGETLAQPPAATLQAPSAGDLSEDEKAEISEKERLEADKAQADLNRRKKAAKDREPGAEG